MRTRQHDVGVQGCATIGRSAGPGAWGGCVLYYGEKDEGKNHKMMCVAREARGRTAGGLERRTLDCD